MSVVIFGSRGARLAAFTVGVVTIVFAAFTHSGGQMANSCRGFPGLVGTSLWTADN